MSLHAVTKPEPFVTLAEVKEYLRVDGEHSDNEISQHIETACAELDGLRSLANRAVMQQTLRLELPALTGAVRLPRPPLISITSVTVTDANGADSTPSYLVENQGSEHVEAMILPATGKNWPASSGEPGSIAIVYEAGYEPVDSDPRAQVPAQMRAAAYARVAQLYDRDERAAPILADHWRTLVDPLTVSPAGGY